MQYTQTKTAYFTREAAYFTGDCPCLTGDCSCLAGDCPYLVRDCPCLVGDCPYLVGDCPYLVGDCRCLVGDRPYLVGDCSCLLGDCLYLVRNCPCLVVHRKIHRRGRSRPGEGLVSPPRTGPTSGPVRAAGRWGHVDWCVFTRLFCFLLIKPHLRSPSSLTRSSQGVLQQPDQPQISHMALLITRPRAKLSGAVCFLWQISPKVPRQDKAVLRDMAGKDNSRLD